MTVTVETLKAVLDAFNRHDLDAIMAHFAEDAVFESPRRFAGIPDVHYGDDRHFVAGDRGASEWTLTGTTTDGERIEVRGCDLWEFRDGLIVRKDSYWKRIDPR